MTDPLAPTPPTTSNNALRRRWPLIALLGVLLVLAAWGIARRRGESGTGGEAKTADGGAAKGEGKEGEGKEKIDSVVTLDSAAMRLVAIELVPARTSASAGVVANGTIVYDANHVSVVAPRAEGRVVTIRADLGQPVEPGAVLAVLESSEIGETRGTLERVRATLDVAKQTFEREKSLYEQQVSSQKEMLEAQAQYRAAQAEYNAARAKIRALGASPDTAADAGGSYMLASPVAGVVVERNAMPGQIVGPSTNLFTVADLRRVWIDANVYESDLHRIRLGAPATVATRALGSEAFHGRVTYAGGVVDTASRTVKVRVEVDNAGRRLRPGMYAQVQIEAPPARGASGPASRAPVVVPELAVQELNGKPAVFVPAGASGRFVARPVTVGARTGGGFVSILSGLKLGDQVVARGAFQLKSELLKASFGEKD
jgi:cobalt-zinc-cadmium efflux system membrane fusion protein